MKPVKHQIALERMQILIDSAISHARTDPKLSRRHALLARKISIRYKVRMPYHLRMTFCKKCKSFIAPGVDSTFRVGSSNTKSIKITCGFCGHTYRKIMAL